MGSFHDLHKISGRARDSYSNVKSKIVLIGGSGWLGLCTLDLLSQILPDFPKNILCFGSKKRKFYLSNGHEIKQEPMYRLSKLSPDDSDTIINFSFLTKDKLSIENKETYIEINRNISRIIFEQAFRLKIKRLATISSGAVYHKEGGIFNDINKNIYGTLKFEEENLFSGLANEGTHVVIPRVFNVSGPYTNKIDILMLSSLINQAINGNEIKIEAAHEVFRSFVAISELMSTVLSVLFDEVEGKVTTFDTVGEKEFEIGDLAKLVVRMINPMATINRPEIDRSLEVDNYLGSDANYLALIKRAEVLRVSLEDQVKCTAEYLKSIH